MFKWYNKEKKSLILLGKIDKLRLYGVKNENKTDDKKWTVKSVYSE